MSFIQPDWIVLAAGITLAAGYLIINQVILRLLVALGTFFYIWYYLVALDDPRAAVATSVVMGIANFLGLAQIWIRRSKWAIPKEHADIYEKFHTLPPGDFRDLLKVATRRVLSEDLQATTEGENVHQLYFVLQGKIMASKFGQSFELPCDIFVGEVAYLTEQNASATTTIFKSAEVLEWDVSRLRKKSKKDRFRLALEAIISSDLAQKVTVAVAPKDYKSDVN